MGLVNCARCGRVFLPAHSDLCPSCAEEDQRDFKIVQAALEAEPNLDVSELTKRTGVAEERILAYVRRGRLQVAGYEATCRRCGTSIKSGLYCTSCSALFAKALNVPGGQQKSGGMYTWSPRKPR